MFDFVSKRLRLQNGNSDVVLDDKNRKHYRKLVRGWISKEHFDMVLIEMFDMGLVHETYLMR